MNLNINSLIQSIKNIRNNKKAKIVFVLPPFVVIIFIVYLLSTKKQKSAQPTKIPIPTNTPLPTLKPAKEPVYFLNQITTSKTPVTGHSWFENKLFYSTLNGIYKAGTNEVVVETPIKYISWSQNAKAVYKSNNRLYLIDSTTKKVSPLPFANNSPLLSPDGNYILYTNRSIVNLFDISKQETHSQDLEINIDKIFWSNDSEWIATEQKTNTTIIQILNKELKVIEDFVFSKETKLLAVSPATQYIVVSENNNLNIVQVSTGNTIDIEIKKSVSDLNVYFIKNNDFIFIETIRDNLDRKIDYIWKVNISGNKEYISNSRPIVRRVNKSIPFSFNASKSVVSFTENNGKIWMISLRPNMLATYSTKGILTFTPISAAAHEDVNP